jgi:hypothetical protein
MGDERWISARDLAVRWQVRDFELINRLSMWNLPTYNQYGVRVYDPNTWPRAPKYPLEFFESTVRAQERASRVIGKPRAQRPPLTDGEIKAEANRLFKAQPLELVDPPKIGIQKSFTMPADPTKAEELVIEVFGGSISGKIVEGYSFNRDDVERCEQEHSIEPVIENKQAEIANEAVEDNISAAQEENDTMDIINSVVFEVFEKAMSCQDTEETASWREVLESYAEEGHSWIEQSETEGPISHAPQEKTSTEDWKKDSHQVSQKDRELLKYAKEKLRNRLGISIPDIVRSYRKAMPNIMFDSNGKEKRGYTQETLEKSLRRLLISAK